MSFLSEVLSAAEKTEIEIIKTKIPELSQEITDLKSEIWHYMNNVYNKFNERPQKNNILLKKATTLSEDLDVLRNTIEEHLRKDIPKIENDLSTLSLEIEEADIILSAVSKFVVLHDRLMNIRNFQEQKQYIECVKEIQSAYSEINELEVEEEVKRVTTNIRRDLLSERTLVCEALDIIFGDNILLNSSCVGSKTENTIRINYENNTFKDALVAFHMLDSKIFLLQQISNFLINEVCLPILQNVVFINIVDDQKSYSFVLTYTASTEVPKYQDIFSHLLKVFQYLHTHFNYHLTGDYSTLLYVVNEIKSSLVESVIKYCLLSTVPSNEVELEKYDEILTDISKFESQLHKYSVFEEKESPFTDYMKDIDKLYVNKKCQEYTEIAIKLMKKDLHEMVETGILIKNKPLLEDAHDFPKCSVSKSVLELLKLIENMLQKAMESPEVCAKRIVSATQNILNMYGSVVSENHQKMLQTIPQQVALFKNNCWHLAYKLDSWNELYNKKIKFINDATLFKDQSHQLRCFGADVFRHYVQGQVQQIEEILKNSSLGELQTLSNSNNNIEKAVRQCIRQQELLRTVWHKVLSYNDYNETLGYIFNSFCTKLMEFVLLVEDLSSDIAEQLADTFKIVQTRGPKLFTEPKEINMYVEVWYRFNELVFMLNASLVEINDRWADGKGPLALVMKPEEVKRLVRALFQNTDRRAALLAKIS
ncbi:centromere/kinetochore protein zw10 homolog [Agrilus planipennis]|uniref:Centromere/kinetochore protein zw10 homolog n=1 Tax=Agrilus planipennis TaxID=224129 RepID=A0A1W4XM69_AGRPL|nr:centromere/kinetochore protein zw10 homolog [Agrilus planipennis]